MLKKNQAGIAHLGLLLFVIVIAVIGGVGYYVWKQNSDETTDTASVTTPAPKEECEGAWYDSHTHLDEMEFSMDLAKLMKKHSVGCSLMFAQVDINDPEVDVLKLKEEFSPNPGRFVLFADVIEDKPSDVTKAKLESLQSEYPDTFKGLGEFVFYRGALKGTSLESEPWPTIFEFAAKNDLFVMVHLVDNQADQLDAMLSKYPDTKVLVHNSELQSDLPSLLKKHKNFYYTLDTTNLTSLKEGSMYRTTFFPPASNGAKDFLNILKQNRSQLLKQTASDWLPIIEAAPDRVMWGTDVAIDWHLEPEVYSELIKFSEDFVNNLPEKYRDGYRYENALKAFGGGVNLKEPTDAEFDKIDAADENSD